MSRAFKRRLRHAAEDPLPEPEPDMSGWTPYQRLLWAAENGKYEELVAKARQERPPPRMTTPEENEAPLRPEGKWPVTEPAAEMKAPAVEPRPAPPSPSEPKPDPQWWEERARWRARGAADYDWEDGTRYECLHEYDPLAEEDDE